ncbi:MAG TPA: hypothetical protein VLU25_04950 [Acidobacteriota bacterium]|nr:hypothetical protein [Acidobacteriota bacterium]
MARPSLVTFLVFFLAATGFSGSALAQDESLFLIVPRAVQNAGEVTGLAFANPSEQSAEVRVFYLDDQGENLVDDIDLVIPARAQEARNLEEYFGPVAADSQGWILAITDNISVVGFFLTSNPPASRIDGAEALVGGQLSRQIVYPEVVQQGGAATQISVVGFGSDESDLEVTFELRAADGSVVESVSRVLPPLPALGSQLVIGLDELFTEPIPEEAYISATASEGGGLVGFEIFGDNQATAGRNAFDSMGEAFPFGSSLFGAQVATGSLDSTLTVINPTGTPANLTLTATPTSDAPPEQEPVSVERLLPAGGVLKEDAAEMFGLVGDFVGWVRVDSDITGLLGDVTFGAPDGSFLSSVELQTIPVRDIVYSQVAQVAELPAQGIPGALTGITFLNPNPVDVDVDLFVYDLFGFLTGEAHFILQAGQHLPRQLFEIIDGFADQAGGSIRVLSDHPIFSFELFGFLSGGSLTALSAVPPQRPSARLEGSFTVDGEAPGGALDESLSIAALDPVTQLTIFSAPVGADFSLLVFNGTYDLIAGTDLDDNGIICETGDLCGAVVDGQGQIESVEVEAGEVLSGLTIDLTVLEAPLSLRRSGGRSGDVPPVRLKPFVRPGLPR